MPTDFEHSPLGHLTRDVLSGKTREVLWPWLRLHVSAETPDEAWELLKAWGREHGISLLLEDRTHARKTQTWVVLSPTRRR